MDVAAHALTGRTVVYDPAMTRRTTLALIAVAVIGLAVGSLAAWWVMNRSSDAAPSWLFSQAASGGSLTQEADGTYTLTLTGVSAGVVAFTDRPVRDATIIDSNELVQAWPNLFAGSAPNAVLVEHGADGQQASAVLTLTGVTSNADTLTYTATLITDKVPSGLTALADVPNTQPPASFASASLFIDAAALGCSADSCLSPVEQGILKDLGYSDEPPQSAA